MAYVTILHKNWLSSTTWNFENSSEYQFQTICTSSIYNINWNFCKPSSDGTRKFGWFWGVGQIEGLILHRHFYGSLEGFHWESGQGIGRLGERAWGKENWGGRKEKRGRRREKTGGEGENGERREKRTLACPSHLHCIQTLYARFGRSVLKTRS